MSATRTPKGTTKKPTRSKSAASSKKSQQPAKQRGARSETHECEVCGRPYKTERGLADHVESKHPKAQHEPPRMETTAEAVERQLRLIPDSARRAVLVASVRRLASGLDTADETDRPKITKELSARMAELMMDASPADDDEDWTEE